MTMTPLKPLFRSHLMQQFAAAARHQSRPPLALAAATSSSRSSEKRSTSSTSFASSSTATRGSILASPTHSATAAGTNSTLASSDNVELRLNSEEDGSIEQAGKLNKDTTSSRTIPLATSLQSLITSRRTQSKFSLDNDNQEFLRLALDRAIVCAQAAPNHYKTEPFYFKRMLAPSNATFRLSEIASQVVLQKKLKVDPDNAEAHAARKFEKWNCISAFLVALVENNQNAVPLTTTNDEDLLLYKPLPYMPPTTERQLEDYASACAAIQNVLLSLHAEGIGTKWATGPVIQTPAFRQLVNCGETDRVAGLIMIGKMSEKEMASPRRRRYRKEPHQLVEDL